MYFEGFSAGKIGKEGKIAKDRRSRREFMLRHIVASDRQYYISLCKAKYPL
jgi:hypothetical protein